VELTAVLAFPAPVEASWRVLCSYRSGFEGCSSAVGRLAAVVGRFEGAVDGGPYGVQRRAWWRPAPVHSNSARVVAAVLGVALQGRGWPHRVDSDGDDRSSRPDVTAWPCVSTEKTFEGAAGPLRGRGMLAVQEWAA
jgi:hypothetical protein